MATVTVAGAHGQIVSLQYDTPANAALAQQLAAVITAGVENGTISPAVDTDGPPPKLPHHTTGEFVQTLDGATFLPRGYKDFVDTAQNSVVFGSGDAGEAVLSSIGNMEFFATGGSGTVAAGGGNNLISIPTTDHGSWTIVTGNGSDTVLAQGRGNDAISTGGGNNWIVLGDGRTRMQSTGDDTVVAGSGQETIAALGDHNRLIEGGASQLFYVGSLSNGGATVYGGTGSDTFYGGSGSNVVYGGTAGKNVLFAGSGSATLFGGGAGNQFYAGGDDTFVFTRGQAGGGDTITGFAHGRDVVDLQGYGSNEVTQALEHEQVQGGNTTITLSDKTTITFVGVANLAASDFVITGSTGSGNGNGNGSGNGNGKGSGDDTSAGGAGSQNGMDTSQLRNMVIGNTSH